jgi:nitroreductase
MEVGAVAQNVYLQAQPMKLGAALVGGFDDAAVGALLRLPGRTSAVALLCLGYPA